MGVDAVGGRPEWVERERALARLEDVLLALPEGRALPGLDTLLAVARIDLDVLADDRARKLLAEALLTRPFRHLDSVLEVRTEVELLTFEVEILTDRIVDPQVCATVRDEHRRRIAAIRARLAHIQQDL